MKRLAVVADSADHARNLELRLAGHFDAEFHALHELAGAQPRERTFVDVDLKDAAQVANLKCWLKGRPEQGQVIFAVNRGSRHEAIQAYAIGATDVLPRPVNGKLLRQTLRY